MMGRVTIVNLETLCWIARPGSFTAAAERLNTTQPAISKRVKELEDAIGISLFQRQGRRMELTLQGRDLVCRVDDSTETDHARGPLRAGRGAHRGHAAQAALPTADVAQMLSTHPIWYLAAPPW